MKNFEISRDASACDICWMFTWTTRATYIEACLQRVVGDNKLRKWNTELDKYQNEQPKPILQSQKEVVILLGGVLGLHAL